MGAQGSLAVLILLGLGPAAGAQDPEEKIKDTDYDSDYAAVVKAYEAAERRMGSDAADALRRLEEQVLPALPRIHEARLLVVYTGINKGAERERHDFFPYRLAGRCALAADLPEKAVEYLKKSPSSGELLAKAERALAEKQKRAAPQPPPPPPVLQKPRIDLAPFLARRDYEGALKELEANRDRLGNDYAGRMAEVRNEASNHVARQTAALAAVLPRLLESEFFKEHLEPCLKECSRVPADLETQELRWAKKLAEWFKKRDPEEFERLALQAARFDENYHTICRQAQENRISEMEQVVTRIVQSTKAKRPSLMTQLDTAERAFQALSAARPYKELNDALAALKGRLPVDVEALDRARAGAGTIKDIRVMAGELERLWTSNIREKLSIQDRGDLALYLGIYRSMALFLDGKRIEEVAADLRVNEVFSPVENLPADLSPKVTRVHGLVRKPR